DDRNGNGVVVSLFEGALTAKSEDSGAKAGLPEIASGHHLLHGFSRGTESLRRGGLGLCCGWESGLYQTRCDRNSACFEEITTALILSFIGFAEVLHKWVAGSPVQWPDGNGASMRFATV